MIYPINNPNYKPSNRVHRFISPARPDFLFGIEDALNHIKHIKPTWSIPDSPLFTHLAFKIDPNSESSTLEDTLHCCPELPNILCRNRNLAQLLKVSKRVYNELTGSEQIRKRETDVQLTLHDPLECGTRYHDSLVKAEIAVDGIYSHEWVIPSKDSDLLSFVIAAAVSSRTGSLRIHFETGNESSSLLLKRVTKTLEFQFDIVSKLSGLQITTVIDPKDRLQVNRWFPLASEGSPFASPSKWGPRKTIELPLLTETVFVPVYGPADDLEEVKKKNFIGAIAAFELLPEHENFLTQHTGLYPFIKFMLWMVKEEGKEVLLLRPLIPNGQMNDYLSVLASDYSNVTCRKVTFGKQSAFIYGRRQ